MCISSCGIICLLLVKSKILPIIHTCRQWADILLIAPMSADLMSKAAFGVSDTVVLSVIRAWKMKDKPIIACPAMNTEMFRHPTTQSALKTFQEWGYRIVSPVSKVLACNEEGEGALADVSTILDLVTECCSAVNIAKQEYIEFLEKYFSEHTRCCCESITPEVVVEEERGPNKKQLRPPSRP